MISFFVPGKPIPQGSAKAFNVGGKARVFTGASNESTPLGGWRARVAEFASKARGDRHVAALQIRLHLDWYLPRPKKLEKLLRAPAISRRCGDIDKLERSILDGLTGVIFLDDSQVTTVCKSKWYTGNPDSFCAEPGVKIEVYFPEDLP